MEDSNVRILKFWKLNVCCSGVDFNRNEEFLYSTREKAFIAFEQKISSELDIYWKDAYKKVNKPNKTSNLDILNTVFANIDEVNLGYNLVKGEDYFVAIQDNVRKEKVSIEEVELKIY